MADPQVLLLVGAIAVVLVVAGVVQVVMDPRRRLGMLRDAGPGRSVLFVGLGVVVALVVLWAVVQGLRGAIDTAVDPATSEDPAE